MIVLVAYATRLARYRRFVRSMLALSLAAAIAWGLTPWYGLTFNMSTSLPGTLYFIRKRAFQPAIGDTIAFRWHGGATYPAGLTFIKHVAGVPGDVVRVVGREVWVNQTYIGYAKPLSLAGLPLFPTSPGVIPPGHYFVATPNPNSLDSRYAIAGTVPQSAIVGEAYEIF
ncbi:peptidase S26 [Burkholderia gladioli]|uniref:S26 family signal peptidase n=1 Tax=Burkholderia gladioli TaxID=28095 RepID=UPI00050DB401|nr:S26 family signal peptidase [Burkholderia gladioli]KGE10476.1 peptidase S26 [Burkholderia gladioli]